MAAVSLETTLRFSPHGVPSQPPTVFLCTESDMRLKLHLPQAPTLPLFTAVIFVLHSECLLGVV